MREIKFRGKLTGWHWYYGLLTKKRLSYAIAVGECSEAEIIPVEEETIGEYTGFKNVNGVEIYDGDILIDEDGEKSVVYRTEGDWCNGDPVLVEGAGLYDSELDEIDLRKYKVAGNIFEGE